MTMVDGSTVLEVPDPVLMRKVHDEVVLLDMASEQYFGLDAVGACVIEAIQPAPTSTAPSPCLRGVRCARGSDPNRRRCARRGSRGERAARRHVAVSGGPVAARCSLQHGLSHLRQPVVLSRVAQFHDRDSLDDVCAPFERALRCLGVGRVETEALGKEE
jgi:hypothetical protein